MGRRRLLAALAAATAAFSVVASASSLGGVSVSGLAAGAAPVMSCDADGLTSTYTTSGGKVTQVIVGGIADPGCEGAMVSLTLVATGSSSVGSGGPVTVPTDADSVDNSVAVPMNIQPDAVAVTGIHIVMVGP
jgi:hypothetical protein